MYWASTKSPRQMWRSRITPEQELYLRANIGIDAALLARDLRLQESTIRVYQRELGLRPLNPNRYRRKT